MRSVYLLRFLGKYLPEKNLRVLRVRRKNNVGEKKHQEKEREKDSDEEEEEETAEIVYSTKKLKNEIPYIHTNLSFSRTGSSPAHPDTASVEA